MGMDKEKWAVIQSRQKFSASVRRLVCKLQILSDKADMMQFTELSMQLGRLSEDIKVFANHSDIEIRSLKGNLYSDGKQD